MLTLGDADAVEQLRSALAVGCHAATLVQAEASTFGPADVAREIAAVVRDHEAAGRAHDLVLLGNDAADSGRLPGRDPARLRARPTGGQRRQGGRRSTDGTVTARVEGPDGVETYRVPLPAVVTIREGGVEPRYPSVPGRMKAKKVAVEERTPERRADRTEAGEAPAAPAGARPTCRSSARVRPPRPPWSTCSRSWGCCPDDPDPGREEPRRLRPSRCRSRRSPSRAGSPPRAAASRSTRSSSPVTGRADRRAAQGAGGVRRPPRPPRRRRRRRGVLRCRLGLGDPVGARAGEVGGRDGRRHRPRQRADGPRGRPRRRGDGRQRAVVRRARAVRGHPPGRRRCRARGDAARPAAGGLLGRRSRRRGRRRPTSPAPRTSSSSRRRSPPPTWWRGWSPSSRSRPTSPAG